MEKLREKTKKEQVATSIREQILGGTFQSGDKLPGVRKLAVSFSVSPQVIVDAFDILDAGKFIERRHGSGVFIRNQCDIGITNVGLIGFFEAGLSTSYFAEIAEMSMLPYLKPKYNFTIRTVTSHNWDDYLQEKEELNLMFQCMRLDCLLLHAPHITEQCVEFALSQNIPVIFIGDFIKGCFSKYDYHQLGCDNYARGKSMVQSIVDKEQCSDITIYHSNGTAPFISDYYRGICDSASELGIQLHTINFPDGCSHFDDEKRLVTYTKIFSTLDEKILGYPAINNGVDFYQFRELTPKILGWIPDFYVSVKTRSFKKRFYDFIYNEINRVVHNPNDREYVMLPLEDKIEKYSTILEKEY